MKCDEEKDRWTAPAGTVDIWWRGPKHGALALLMAHLLVQSHEWRRRRIRILCTLPLKGDSKNMDMELREILETARIEADVQVFITDDPHWEIAKQTGESNTRNPNLCLLKMVGEAEGTEDIGNVLIVELLAAQYLCIGDTKRIPLSHNPGLDISHKGLFFHGMTVCEGISIEKDVSEYGAPLEPRKHIPEKPFFRAEIAASGKAGANTGRTEIMAQV